MDKVKELKINSTLWATLSRLANFFDFKPEKLSIETKSNSNNDIKVDHVRYENGGFYLTINNLRGYFNFSNNLGTLTMIFANDDQQNKYHQVWKEIFKIINGGYGELKLHEKISLFDNDLPIEHVLKMLEYDRIDLSEGVDVNKNILTSKKCYLCGYWYFVNKNFNYQKYMCNGCHDMSMKAISMHNLCIGYNNGNAYRINFVYMSKNDALILIKNAVIIDKKGTL